ncbi:hypothetical protein ACHAQJ_005495 [Trichoderma viride]
MSKVLTVFGATGSQGGSVIRSVLSHPTLSSIYKIRGVTRSLTSDASKALEDSRVEMIQAHWEYQSGDIEFAQGKAIADACKSEGVELLVWSSLSSATEVTGGKLPNIHHFESKAKVEKHIRSLGIPAAFVDPGCFMSNLKTMLSKISDEAYEMSLPMPSSTEIPMIDEARDTGEWVVSILLKQQQVLGQRFVEAAAWYTIDDICSIFRQATGKRLVFKEVSEADFSASVGDQMCEAWLLVRDFAYFGSDARERLNNSLKFLNKPPTTLQQYLMASGQW